MGIQEIWQYESFLINKDLNVILLKYILVGSLIESVKGFKKSQLANIIVSKFVNIINISILIKNVYLSYE